MASADGAVSALRVFHRVLKQAAGLGRPGARPLEKLRNNERCPRGAGPGRTHTESVD